jgi:molecular chaperone GrpE (heat shock protein)
MSHGFSFPSLIVLKDVRSCQNPSANLKKKAKNNQSTTNYSFRHTSSVAPAPEIRVSLLQVIMESDPTIFEEVTEEFSEIVEETLQNLHWLNTQVSTLEPALNNLKNRVPRMRSNYSEINKQFINSFDEFVEFAEPSIEHLKTQWGDVLKNTEQLKNYLCIRNEDSSISSILSSLHSILGDFKSTLHYIRRTSNPQAIY